MQRKISFSLILAIGLCALFLLPPLLPDERAPIEQTRNNQTEGGKTVKPSHELAKKRQIMQRDVEITNRLCRAQCYTSLHRLLQQTNADGRSPITTNEMQDDLKRLQQDSGHMIYLRWRPPTSERREVVQGKLNESLRTELADELRTAERAAEQGKGYASAPKRIGKDDYFVLNVPSPSAGSIIGVVHQHVLDTVHKESRKNLRIVPFPSDKRYKIESVDADTLKDVRVNHPEQNEGTSHYHVDHIVVKFRKEPTPEQIRQIRKDINGKAEKKLGYTYVFESHTYSAKHMMDYFRDHWDPEYVEPHFIYLTNESDTSEAYVPNDLLFAEYQWNLPIIQTLEGWNINRGTEDVVIAVIDTGVDIDHPDLAGRLAPGMNFIAEHNEPFDDVGHGTHVAGIIAATVDNVEGVAGMSWFNKVMPVKVLDESGAGSSYSVAQGIIWAADNGAKVINMSLGNYVDSSFLHDAIKYAYDRDVVLVAATGNDNTGEPGYPAAYPEVVAVSATDARNQKAVFSNFGHYVDVVAPGENIASTYFQKQYAALSGTSMASPHVAALAGMIRSLNPDLTNVEVMELLRTSVVDLGEPGKDPYYGYGRIDVKKALESALHHEQSILLWPKKMKRLMESLP